jgi:uncharacterized Fe-S cluster protein YjdI
MAAEGIVKRYTNGELTVVWRPALCIHSTTCFRGLPAVFDPRRRPWVDARAASTAEIVAQVGQCPSGALSLDESAPALGRPAESRDALPHAVVEPTPGGPLLVRGTLEVKGPAGAIRKEGVTAFCRCGASGRKPFCDGSHARIGFAD